MSDTPSRPINLPVALGFLRSLVRKNHPGPHPAPYPAASPELQAELERLAHLSPHLLTDLGFEVSAQQDGTEVWRRRSLQLRIFIGPGRIEVQIDA